MRGQIDAVHEILPSAIEFLQAKGQTNVRTFPFTRPYFIYLLFNVKHPILKDARVRQALSYAVDRQAIIDRGLDRQGPWLRADLAIPLGVQHGAEDTTRTTLKRRRSDWTPPASGSKSGAMPATCQAVSASSA